MNRGQVSAKYRYKISGIVCCIILLTMMSVIAYASDKDETEEEEFCPYCEKAGEYKKLSSPKLAAVKETTDADHPILYLFWGEGCPHCEEEKEFLALLRQQYPELEMRFFEIWDHPEFAQLAEAIGQAYQVEASSVPLTFLGELSIVGFRSFEETGIRIEDQVRACLQKGCIDALDKVGPLAVAAKIRDEAARNTPVDWQFYAPSAAKKDRIPKKDKNVESKPTVQPPKTQPVRDEAIATTETITVPLIGGITVSQVGLPLFTLIIAGLDGFNPCAMWVLSFLLTLVIYAKSRTKILLIGGIFVLASGAIYFLFMIAWLNVFMLVGYVKLLRIAVGVVAVVMGIINCKDFFFFKKGLSLTIPDSAQPKLFKQMRELVHKSAIPGVLFGTIFLAVTANLIELLCTAGFPAIYTRILTLQDFSVFQYYLYLVFYNAVYVIPLAAIVGVFAWKMGGRKLTEKEGRILKLVGGVLMLALGTILLVKPQLLMFG